jgi:transcriptional regulator with XRE-family HTH domain
MLSNKNHDSGASGDGPTKHSAKRNRGVFLSAQGIRRLRAAINRAEIRENEGRRFSAENIGLRAGVSTATISRLWSSKSGVDQRTLRLIFSAFGLDLTDSDIQLPGARAADQQDAESTQAMAEPVTLPYPRGPIPLGSPLYMLRSPLEERAYHEITQPGCLIRIKAPSGFGKSSLLLRVLDRAEQLGYAIASINLQQAEPATLAEAGSFLRWFCGAVALKLGKTADLEDSWNDILGNSLSTTVFLQEQILEASNVPVVLNIQEFNGLFAYPETAQAFLPLLRSWYEEARHDEIWQGLRQVVTYATDSYLPLDINQSPFNVGLPLLLPEFTAEQIHQLAELHQLPLTDADCNQLMQLVGGHPTLVRIALYHLSQGDISLDDLSQTATTPDSIFHPFLQQMLVRVQDGPEQMAQIRALVMADGPVSLDPIVAYQLEATGLIATTPDGWVMRLNLYRDYFRQRLFEWRE